MAPRKKAKEPPKKVEQEDYYAILQVGRDAKDEDLKNAYHQQARRWHPDKNKDNMSVANDMFRKIHEAYNVLSDPKTRAAYDPLFKLAAAPSTVIRPIKQTNRYDDIFGPKTPAPAESSGKRLKRGEYPLPCTLEELYNGVVKRRKININGSGDVKLVDEVISIEVQPGWKNGTKISYDQPNGLPNFGFVVQETPHPVFCRRGHDLIATREVSLVEALTGFTANVTTLDGRNLSIPIQKVMHSKHEEVVEGEGMPVTKEPTRKGNLIIKFDIKFPTELSDEQKAQLTNILPSEEQKADITSILPSVEQKADTTNILPSEEQKADSTNILPSEEQKADTTNILPSEEQKADVTNILSSEEQKAELTNIFPSEKQKADVTNILSSEEEKADVTYIFPSEEQKAELTNILLCEELEADTTNILPSEEQKADVTNILPSEEQKADVTNILSSEEQKVDTTNIFPSEEQKADLTNILGSEEQKVDTTNILPSEEQKADLTNIFPSEEQKVDLSNILPSEEQKADLSNILG